MRSAVVLSMCLSSLLLSTRAQANYHEGMYVYGEGDEQVEANLLEKLKPIASRTGGLLSLSLESGKSVTFRNKDSCHGYQDCEQYLLNGLLPGAPYFVINAAFWEGSNVYLVSRQTGNRYEVYAEPHVSPDARHIASASPAEAYNVNGVFLWEVQGGTLIPRFRFEPSTYALYRFSRWDGPNIVRLIKFTNSTKDVCPNGNFMELPVRLLNESGNWRLDENSEPGSAVCR